MLRTLCRTDYRPITMPPCNLLCAPFPSPRPLSGLSPALCSPALCPAACSYCLHHIPAPPLRCAGLCAGSAGCSPLLGWVLSGHAASCMESRSQFLRTSTFLLVFCFFPSSFIYLFFSPPPFLFSALAAPGSHWGIANSAPFVCCPAAARRGGLGFAWKSGVCLLHMEYLILGAATWLWA